MTLPRSPRPPASLYDKFALMNGAATARHENRDVTDSLDDHEKDALREMLDEVLQESAK